MKLSALLSGYAQVAPHGDVDVDAVTFDSRKVKPRTVFIAAKGATPSSLHGKDFISAARAAGAAAIVADEDAASLGGGVYVVDDARRVGAVLAERVVGSPSSQLALAGVTGTNGKTTTTFLLASMAKAAKRRGAVFGTVGIGAPESPRATGFTTPEAETLSTQLRAVKDEGFDVVAMEVTSIALATARVDGLTFAAGGFTNLTHDHLDFHGDLERYFTAKARFFSELLPKTDRKSVV